MLPADTTLPGEHVTPLRVTTAGNFSVDTTVVPLSDAETRTAWPLEPLPIAALKDALLAPATTVTLAGTVIAVELLLNATTAPPEAAGPGRATVQLAELPVVTLVGVHDIAVSAAAVPEGSIAPTVGVAAYALPMRS